MYFAIAPANAEIILDDFDDPLEIRLPEMQNRPYVKQPGIGPLKAERWSDVKAFSVRPTGRLDAGISRQSALTFEFNNVVRTDNLSPIVAATHLYMFNEIDITEGGLNDRFVVDFAYLRSTIPMANVTVFVQDASQPGISYGKQIFEIPPNDGPFSLEFPFNSFGIRGGGGGDIDYRRLNNLDVNITPIFFDDINEFSFSTAIERIRFARAVPEPSTLVLVSIGTLGMISLLTQRRRMSL
jgi:hypothetical protein